MFKYKGSERVGKGTYWNLLSGRRTDVSDKGILPGDKKSTFIRVPSGLMLIVGPILGLLYVIFLPFVAIAIMVTLLVKKMAEGIFHLARNFVSFGWRPTEAYLGGKKKEVKKKNVQEPD